MADVPKGSRALFAIVPETTSAALLASAKRLGVSQAKIVNEALSTHLLALSSSPTIQEADARYEAEIARLSASAAG